jgi:hypothetical protein
MPIFFIYFFIITTIIKMIENVIAVTKIKETMIINNNKKIQIIITLINSSFISTDNNPSIFIKSILYIILSHNY